MGFSDAATPCLWVGNIKAGLQQKDVLQVFSSFGAIRRIKLGPAPPGTSATGLAAEVHFASIAQAAAALTALNAIVVPRLSGHQPLAIQCWQPSGAAVSHAAAPPAPQRPAAAAVKAAPARAAAAPGPLGPQPVVRPTNLAEAAAAVELPGAEDLQAAFAFFEGCAFLAVPEEERASTAKWAVLQALLARGLRHLGGCSFRQLPVLLTHVGDELLKHRGSNPAVEAEYQSYPAAGRLTSLVKDVQSPGLLQVLTEGKAANTAVVQLHLGRLALAGGAPGGGSGASGGGSSGGAAPPKPRPAASGVQQAQPPPGNQYVTNSVPSRHLLLLGVGDRDDVARLAGIARQHGTLQKYLHNPRNSSLTLHFDSKEEALNMAREVEGQCLPGLSHPSPLQVQYKHLLPASKAGAAGAAGAAAGHPKAPPARSAAAVQPAVKAGKSKQEAPAPTWQYSATVPSSSLRVKKLDGAVASRQSLAEVGQSCCGSDFTDCTFFPSSGIGYLFFKNEAAAAAAADVLRGTDLLWKQAEPLVVEFRHPAKARLDGTSPAPTAAAKAAGPQSAAAASGGAGAGAAVDEAPPCCACCGASGEGVALSRCSGCRVVHYCGRDCQLKDWPARHATECSQLQQLAAALQAAQPAAGGPQLQLLVAALRSPGGREARMLRSLLGADAFPDSSQAGTDSSSGNGGVSSDNRASGGDAPAAEEQPAGEAAGDSNGAAAAAADDRSSEAAVSDEDGELAPAAAESAAEPGAESDAAHAGSGSAADGTAASEAAAAAVAADEPAAAAKERSDGPAASEPAERAAPAEPAEPAEPAGGGSDEGEQLPAQQAALGSEAAAADGVAAVEATVAVEGAEEPAAEAADDHDGAAPQAAETAGGTAQQAGVALQAELAAEEQAAAEAAAAEEQAEELSAAEAAGGAAEAADAAAEAPAAAETAATAEIGPAAEGHEEAAAAAAEQGEAVAAEEQEAA